MNYKQRRKEANAFSRKRWVRDLVLLGCGHKCARCGAVEDLTIDHVIAVSRGGEDSLANLQALCRPCNARKGDAG